MRTSTREHLIPSATIDRAAQMLLDAAPAGSEVILFGSYARGDAGIDSDLDFMVVEPGLRDGWAESARLRGVLDGIDAPVDVLAVSREQFEAWKVGVNSVVARAHREGRRYAASR